MEEISDDQTAPQTAEVNESFALIHEAIPQLFNSVQELAIFGFWEWEIKTGKVLWSDHLFTMFGVEKGKFVPSFENFLTIVHDKDKTKVVDEVNSAVEKRLTIDYEFTGVLPSGEERIFRTWGGLKLDEEGKPDRVVGIVLDNTEKVKKQGEIKKLNEELKLKNDELSKSNKLLTRKHDEKKVLIKEIHHRVKNNLQIVNSLIRFQSNAIADSKTVHILRDIENRIYAISSLHEKLLQSQDLQHINIKEHFTQIINELMESCSTNTAIIAVVDIDDTVLSTEQLIPLGLIFNELVTNSLEHAFVGMNEGEIHLGIISNAEHEITFTIGDNGIGMSTDTENLREGAVGTELVNIFVDQLNGTLTRLDKNGTFFELKFK